MATEAFGLSSKPFPGPVHINCPLREPLEPSNVLFSTFEPSNHLETTQEADVSELEKVLGYEKGLIIVGPIPQLATIYLNWEVSQGGQ